MPFPYTLEIVSLTLASQSIVIERRVNNKEFLQKLSAAIDMATAFNPGEKAKLIGRLHALVFLPTASTYTATEQLEQIGNKLLALHAAKDPECGLLIHALFDEVLEPANRDIDTVRQVLLGYVGSASAAPRDPWAQGLVDAVTPFLDACVEKRLDPADNNNFVQPLRHLRALRAEMQGLDPYALSVDGNANVDRIYKNLLKHALSVYQHYWRIWTPSYRAQVSGALRACLVTLRTQLDPESVQRIERDALAGAWGEVLSEKINRLYPQGIYADQVLGLDAWGKQPHWALLPEHEAALQPYTASGVVQRVCDDAAAQLTAKAWLDADNWVDELGRKPNLLLLHVGDVLDDYKHYLLPAVGEPTEIPKHPGIYLYRKAEPQDIGVVVVHADNAGHEIFNLTELMQAAKEVAEQAAMSSDVTIPPQLFSLDTIDWSIGYQWQLVSAKPQAMSTERGFYFYKDGQREMLLVVHGPEQQEILDLTATGRDLGIQWANLGNKPSTMAIMDTSSKAFIMRQANPQYLQPRNGGAGKPVAIELSSRTVGVIANACQHAMTPGVNSAAKAYFTEQMLPPILCDAMQSTAANPWCADAEGAVDTDTQTKIMKAAQHCARTLALCPTPQAIVANYQTKIQLNFSEIRFLTDKAHGEARKHYVDTVVNDYRQQLITILQDYAARFAPGWLDGSIMQKSITGFEQACGDAVTRADSSQAVVAQIAAITQEQLAHFYVILNAIITQAEAWKTLLPHSSAGALPAVYVEMERVAAATTLRFACDARYFGDVVALSQVLEDSQTRSNLLLGSMALLRTKLEPIFLSHAEFIAKQERARAGSITNFFSSMTSTWSTLASPKEEREQQALQARQATLQQYAGLEAHALMQFWLQAKDTSTEYQQKQHVENAIVSVTQYLRDKTVAEAEQAYVNATTPIAVCKK